MRNPTPTVILCAALAAALPALPTTAAAAGPGNSLQLVQRDGMSLSDAIAQVRRQYNGRILDADTHVRGNREIHVIKILTEDGTVKTVRIPGRVRGDRG